MKKKIKINFTDFWQGFSSTSNYFTNLLKEEFDVEISNKPDYLFYSIFGDQHRYVNNCVKIQYLGENIPPDLNYADYAMSFDYLDHPNHYRIPHYLLYDGYYNLVNKKIDESVLNRKFCSFIVSNGNCNIRNNFFMKLSKYKKVDSGGRYLNNIGKPVDNKVQWIKDYKFNIAFENNAYRPQHIGYTTEKIMEPMTVNTLPIYWGNPKIDLEFNTKSFINYPDFKSEDDMIDYIIELDKNDDKYMEVMKHPWLPNNEIVENNKVKNIKSFFHSIFC
jgi:hypothetical protein